MPASTVFVRLRAIGLAVVALVAILALLVGHKLQQSGHQSVNQVIIRQPASINVTAPFSTGTSEIVSSAQLGYVALPFGRANHALHFSPISTGPLTKRALSSRWSCLVENGRKYYEDGVLPAFDGHSPYPTPTFTAHDFEANGWKESNPVEEPLPLHWKDAFELVPEGATDDEDDRDEDVHRVYLDQTLPFTNAQGQPDTPPTRSMYYGLYLPNSCAIITSVSYSPKYELQKAGVPDDQIASREPPLHQLSDALWAEWAALLDFPGNLRYYAVEGIKNAIASPLMDEIFNSRRGTTNVPWADRLTFDLGTDEGKALFGSPNGIATAWILIHRAAELGRRTPTVTIFNPDGNNRCMIWDLIPAGDTSVFGPPLTE
ncbi:MAG: hypothetical protein Q9168_001989 [Polycauliona sp. 1 TL-2023]